MNPTAGAQEFDINALRKQFPILDQQVNGHPLVYFDNAATTQKPQRVIDRLVDYYRHDNANIHRGIHTLAERATKGFEDTRKSVAAFINAPSAEEIVFTRGVTEGINLVAASFGKQFIKKGDEILISGLEHHSNIVPWQILCEEKGATLRVINVLEDGTLDLDDFRSRLKKGKTKLVSVNHASNSLGTINPIEDIIREAHYADAAVLIDGAQGVAHLPVDVTALGCDFYVASGHKMYGPTGVGFLYGKRSWLEKMPPWQSGGEMIAQVTFEKTTWNKIPYKFEAGTPNIADVTALGEAIAFIQSEGKEKLAAHEHALLTYASEKMKSVDGIRFYGTALQKVSVISFLMDGFHPFDIGQMLDARGIAVRTGHHCTQPLMDHFRIVGTVRASFAAYNTFEEVDKLVEALKRLEKLRS
ncbi:MAG: SufS family cysteine desulfurase [Bacteroidota bacterium]